IPLTIQCFFTYVSAFKLIRSKTKEIEAFTLTSLLRRTIPALVMESKYISHKLYFQSRYISHLWQRCNCILTFIVIESED
uniref:Ovule protein n=1 Tax=Parascaris univalens TaxID=6257 RepID=A0A915BBG9_PARUN